MATPGSGERRISLDLIARLLLAAGLVLLGLIAAWPLIAPDPAAATAAKDAFSADRAMADLAVVAAAPHGAGSEAQARVRDYILGQAQAAGLAGEVQKTDAVENVIVRVPGSASTRQVLVTGHYDSHPPAPGAGDDGISVAAMLETMRVLAASPALRNDVLFLFTDGEENGYLGSIDFVRKNRPARDAVGVVLCFDSLPGNGPLALRETSPDDGWLIREFAASRPLLYANSYLNGEERGEIDTDCSVFAAAGYLGVEIENTASGTLYHTPGDTVDAISPAIVQGFGVTMERLARHFGGLDLSVAARAPDLAFLSLPLIGIAAYPPWLTPAAAVASMLAFVALVVIGLRRRQIAPARLLLGTLGFLAVVVLIVVLATLLWNLLLDTYPVTQDAALGYLDFAGSGRWKAGIMAAEVVLIIIALYILSRFVNPPSLASSGILAFLLVWWLAYFVMDSANLLTTAHLAWPLVGGVAGFAVLLFARRTASLAIGLFLAAVPVFLLIIPALALIAIPMIDGPWVPMLAIGTVLGLLVPQILFITGRIAFGQPAENRRPAGQASPLPAA